MRLAEYLVQDAFLTFGAKHHEAVVEELENAYSFGGRVYHDLTHAEEVAAHVSFSMKGKWGDHPRALMTLAGLFHDYVDPKSADAEAKSADLFEAIVNDFLPEEAGYWVADCKTAIEATAGHNFTLDRFSQIMSDADLQRFKATDDQYAKMIREEYSEHDDDKFNQGRLNVLATYYLREPFFYFEDDTLARANIKRQLNETIKLVNAANESKQKPELETYTFSVHSDWHQPSS